MTLFQRNYYKIELNKTERNLNSARRPYYPRDDNCTTCKPTNDIVIDNCFTDHCTEDSKNYQISDGNFPDA